MASDKQRTIDHSSRRRSPAPEAAEGRARKVRAELKRWRSSDRYSGAGDWRFLYLAPARDDTLPLCPPSVSHQLGIEDTGISLSPRHQSLCRGPPTFSVRFGTAPHCHRSLSVRLLTPSFLFALPSAVDPVTPRPSDHPVPPSGSRRKNEASSAPSVQLGDSFPKIIRESQHQQPLHPLKICHTPQLLFQSSLRDLPTLQLLSPLEPLVTTAQPLLPAHLLGFLWGILSEISSAPASEALPDAPAPASEGLLDASGPAHATKDQQDDTSAPAPASAVGQHDASAPASAVGRRDASAPPDQLSSSPSTPLAQTSSLSSSPPVPVPEFQEGFEVEPPPVPVPEFQKGFEGEPPPSLEPQQSHCRSPELRHRSPGLRHRSPGSQRFLHGSPGSQLGPRPPEFQLGPKPPELLQGPSTLRCRPPDRLLRGSPMLRGRRSRVLPSPHLVYS
ncbi:hypothetical protein CRENBAI_025771 [Crenichthys baileyi]|uniref:Uncharacterized protein n=1 Tax=Crenichthys baileyi TaxID=28760 RepID=A0AAV9RHD3_9TELE